MSLCRSPLRTIPEKLAQNLLSIAAIERALSAINTDWRAFTETGENCAPLPHEPNESFALSKDLIVNSQVPDSVQRVLNAAATDPTDLISMRGELLSEQTRLQKSYMEEVAQVKEENEQAARRKTDHTPVIYNTIKELTENGILKEIVRELVDEGQMQP
jgi:ubiquitin carboxyl-terminal hydrolase L5